MLYHLNRFHFLVLFTWQFCIFFATQLIFPIFGNYVPKWRCFENETFGKDCNVYLSCENIEFEQIYFYSAALEFDWICGWKAYWAPFSSQLQFFGVLIGTFFWGNISDAFGRKPISATCFSLALLMTAFAIIVPSWKWLITTRLILGFAIGGILVVCYTFVMELLLPQQRMFLRAIFNWGIGRIMLTIICWLFNDWRKACLVCTLMASPALILIIFVLPESPTWFHYNDKPEKMRESERKICKLAGIEMKNIKHEPIIEQKKFSDIIRDRKMLKRVAVLWVMWFVASITGYAIDLGSSNISGNLFLNQILFAILITLSKYVVLILDTSFPHFSRRNLHQFSQSGALICFAILFIFVKTGYNGTWVLIISVIGVCLIECSWDVCYLSGIEVVPTALRASTLGSSSLIARIGAILSPMLTQLNGIHPGSVYAIVFVLGAINVFVSFNWLVETKNINLDHVDVREETTEVNSEIKEDELLL